HPGLQHDTEIELTPIRTAGDWKPEHKERSFALLGGNRDLFTKEIEDALLTGYIDIAVHSMKDVATVLDPRIAIAALLERADPRDAFIGHSARALETLPEGATVGSASLRRQAQILVKRPDLRVVPLRGNVDTRLGKLAKGQVDATILAVAGLARLGAFNRISSILDVATMLPSACQGVIGVEARRDDEQAQKLLAPLGHAATSACVAAERAFVKALEGSCNTPIAALAQIGKDGMLRLEGLAARPDGSEIVRQDNSGPPAEAAQLGATLGEDLKSRLPPDFFAAA
ncbi:MAG TPA: hydroxymethylbilane synthase, partial [Alphaproteobacteria bacterium]|nr:hydroxymethylbilane synthase [Alphaproteobacteria bacterium]